MNHLEPIGEKIFYAPCFICLTVECQGHDPVHSTFPPSPVQLDQKGKTFWFPCYECPDENQCLGHDAPYMSYRGWVVPRISPHCGK